MEIKSGKRGERVLRLAQGLCDEAHLGWREGALRPFEARSLELLLQARVKAYPAVQACQGALGRKIRRVDERQFGPAICLQPEDLLCFVIHVYRLVWGYTNAGGLRCSTA